MSEKYKANIIKLEFNKNIIDTEFDVIESSIVNQPKFSLGYHYYSRQVRKKMNDNELKTRDFFLVVNDFEHNINDYDNDLNHIFLKQNDKNGLILSRSLFKLWEILIYFNIMDDSKKFISFSGGENGGFLQAIYYFRKKYFNSKNDQYCYSLSDNNKIISECVKTVNSNKFKKLDNENILESYDISKSITDVGNIESLIKKNKLKDINLVTFNGTTEFKTNLGRESEVYKIILGSIILSLSIQGKNGSFVLRIEDCFTEVTLKLLNILGNCYKSIHICKPLYSRPFDREKYLICKEFKLDNSKKDKLIKKLKVLLNKINDIENNNNYLFDIATTHKIDSKIVSDLSVFNQLLMCNEHLNINKIIEYKKSKNYFGEKYHKYKNDQIEATKWWVDNMLKDKLKK